MGSVCTIMVGRLDDWLKVVADKQDISVDPGRARMGGLAVFKKTYGLFQERRLSPAPVVGGLPEPHALERAHRRRRRHLAAARVAEAVQRLRRRRGIPHRQTDRAGRSAALNKFADFRRAYDRARALTRGIRHLSADPPHAAPVHHRLPRARWPDSGADASQPGPNGLTQTRCEPRLRHRRS